MHEIVIKKEREIGRKKQETERESTRGGRLLKRKEGRGRDPNGKK